MFELGTLMSARTLAEARQAGRSEAGTMPTPGDLIRQGLTLLRSGWPADGNRRPAMWRPAALPR